MDAQPIVAEMPSSAPAAECHCDRTTQPKASMEQFVYAFEAFEVRFPTLGVEREFKHHERRAAAAGPDETSSVVRTLRDHPHLAERVSYFLTIARLPAYLLIPSNRSVREAIFDGLEHAEDPHRWALVIGRRGNIAPPTMTGGILAPLVMCDLVYNFHFDEWADALHATLAPALDARKLDSAAFRRTTRNLFARLTTSTESLGVGDTQRALNYVLMQHPGPFLAAAERSKNEILDRIETRHLGDMGARKIVAVIFTFVDRTTGVSERLFVRVDVTEEWPFIADTPAGAPGPLALQPYVENELWSAPI